MPLPGQPRNPDRETTTRFRRRRDQYNPLAQVPNRIHARPYVDVERLGESPGTQDLDTRADRQQHATIRRLWRQAINVVPGPVQTSWTADAPAYSFGIGFELTRALRYMATTRYKASGTLNSRFGRPRLVVAQGGYGKRPTLEAGTTQRRPVIRNRITSFGSRVKPLNRPLPGAVQQ